VFVVEQQVPADLEWVGDDARFSAVLAVDLNQQPIGTGRISGDGVIGRMAVLKDWRGRGVGSAILERLIQLGLESGQKQLTLSAQLHAVPFYSGRGFIAEGPVYLDAGIEHRRMTRR
jgi:predicted GNAT family N-acyltransferase